MVARWLVLGSAFASALAVAAACTTFSSEAAPGTGLEAGADAPSPSAPTCPAGPTLVDIATTPADARCGPGGATVDLSSHDHCGTCNHSCRESSCSEGSCVPVPLVADRALDTAVVVGTNVYFVDAKRRVGRARTTEKNGTDFALTVAIGTPVRRLQADAKWLYVSAAGGSYRFALDDSAVEPIPGGPAPTEGIAAIGQDGYFFATVTGVESHLATGTTTAISAGTTTVVADGPSAYWVSVDDAGAAFHGPFPTVIPPLTTVASAAAVTLDASYLYLADNAARLIRRIPREGGAAQSVAAETSVTIGDIAVDGNDVYWTADRGAIDGWVIMRVSKCGGLPVVLAKGLPVLTQLSFDDTYVYTVKRSTPGSLIRVAK